MSKKITAIVPMRHSSERVKGKNYRQFSGKPLFHYIINSLINSDVFHQIVIDTDSPTIINYSKENFSQVIILERPEHLRDGNIPMNDVLLNAISRIEKTDFYFQTHSTNPILTSKTISAATENFLKQYPFYDSLFGVTRLQTRLWDQLGGAINHNPNILLRTQDLPPIYEENSCMYVFSEESLKRKHNRIGERPIMWEVDKYEAIDIDEEIDFELAEFLYKKYKTKNQ